MPTRRSPIDPADLDIGWSLSVLLRGYLKRANERFSDVPGGPRGYQVLVSVERGAPSTQLAMARRLGIDRTVMTYLIDELVDAGLVERRVDPNDRRARTLVCTPKGRRLLPQLDRRVADVEAELLSPMSDQDATRFRSLLREAALELNRLDPSDDPRELVREMVPRTRRPRPDNSR